MISTRIDPRRDGKSSAGASLRYGQGLKIDKETGEYLDKSHRTRFGNFGLIDDGVYVNQDIDEMIGIIDLASIEMQNNCDLNTRADESSKIAHFLVSFDQYEPTEAVLRDTEDSMLSAMGLDNNNFATFLHNDNGHWHLHIFSSRIEKEDPYRVASLWQDQTKRDKVCREVEIRHELKRDNGMHEITSDGKIIEIPLVERRAAREAKRESAPSISDGAKTTEIYSGEKTFQTWANEIRIGDRLKHAKSWKDLHTAAAAYNCEIKQKGAGFIICPVGEDGAIQLSKVGLKNLPAKFGAFQPAAFAQAVQPQPGKQVPVPEAAYQSGPTQPRAQSHYQKWREARDAYQPMKTDRINEQRESHKEIRSQVVVKQQVELKRLREQKSGPDRIAAVSIAKMQHTAAQAEMMEQFAQERKELRAELAGQGPGNTFRDYLMIEASKGDDIALGLARKYGVDASTDVLAKREAEQLLIVAAVTGREYRPAQRMNFTHRIERSGTVVYDFGQGRTVTDSAISRQVQLNDAAATSPEAIATALRFATTKFGNTLTLTGSPEFQRLAVETAVRNRLNINFADPALQAYKYEFEASIKPKNLTPKQIQTGVDHVINSFPGRRGPPGRPPAPILARLAASGLGRVPGDSVANDLVRAEQPATGAAPAKPSGVYELPALGLDAAGQVGRSVLPGAVLGGLENGRAGENPDVRRTRTSTPGGGSGRSTDADAVGQVNPSDAGAGYDVANVRSLGTRSGTRSRNGIQRGRLVRPVEPAGVENERGLSVTEPAIEAAETADLHKVAAPAQPTPRPAPGLTPSNKSAQRAFDVPAALDLHQQPTEVEAIASHQVEPPAAPVPAVEADPYQVDIHQQIAAVSSKRAVPAPDEWQQAEAEGPIVAVNQTFVAVSTGRDEITIYPADQLAAANLDYDGIAEGRARFAVGNMVKVKQLHDGSTTVTVGEERGELQTEERKKRDSDRGR